MFGSPFALNVKVKKSVPHAHFTVFAPGALVPVFLSRARWSVVAGDDLLLWAARELADAKLFDDLLEREIVDVRQVEELIAVLGIPCPHDDDILYNFFRVVLRGGGTALR